MSWRLYSQFRTGLVLAVLMLYRTMQSAETSNPPPEGQKKFHIAFSAGILGEINRNDALAAMLAWGRAVIGQRNLSAEAIPSVFDRPDDLFSAARDGTIDAITVLTDEYFAHPSTTPPDSVFLSVRNGKITERYVLLVRRGNGIQDLSGLKGRSLELVRSPRTSLAPAWLDTLLTARKLGLPETLFSKTTHQEKVSRVINRVFFRQADACVVTQEAFETAVELNPQVGRELEVLATSPEVVPTFFYFRPGLAPKFRQAMEEAVLNVTATASGKQAMTVFQCDSLEKRPLSCLESARALLAEQARVRIVGQEKGKVAAIPSPANP